MIGLDRLLGGNLGKGYVGIELSPDGLGLAHVLYSGKGAAQLSRCEFYSADVADDIDGLLVERVEALKLARIPCNWVMHPSHYTLLLVESPNVPPEEMHEAIRWRIKDLVPYNVDDMTLDYFPLPDDGVRSGKKMVYVVATETSEIRSIMKLAKKANIKLTNIDIAELAIRNIVELVAEDERSIAVVRLRQGAGSLTLIRGDQVYLSRQFDIDYNAGLLDDLPEESLILELQRSLDYYDRQMGQASPNKIYMCGENISDDKITNTMRNSLPGDVQCLVLSDVVTGADNIDDAVAQQCVGAIGGALRKIGGAA
ncbi:pilus assembly protein PilM [Aurantivibrio plasticivorans]